MSGNRIPKYRRQHRKGGDLAFVELSGARHYLGGWGSRESKERYHQLLLEWNASGRRLPVEPEELTVVELCAQFFDYATDYYRKPDGSPTGEIEHFGRILRDLKNSYGDIRYPSESARKAHLTIRKR